ncbi:MmgE/PrpD family protein [Sphingomonas immobilis]|uniref:MmgE/PrpD family protein n=1 Tax=Sphingomonas immobilis TaxID=3063997 RepID=A0ABT9A0M4_9SPHN|nr:MmgE/PrpD family protein [Sphingomonas sp. CA1-15]MDO7843383.1 MmgE/PrpD family protein [Sphingomonas sp. CA1-15]
MTVAQRLAAFIVSQRNAGLPAEVIHEAKRLFLNQLKASVGATTHPAIGILADWATADTQGRGGAHILWSGVETTPQQAAIVNGALYEVLDFHDTFIPCFMHAVSGVLPAVAAVAEQRGASGADLLNALAIGLEVELAVATILMPSAYYRGAVPAGLTGGVGAAAACCALLRIDAERTTHALGAAMCTAFGLYASVGSMTLSYITGATARSGVAAFELAERGFTAPATAFEGDRGMFQAHCDEDRAKIETVLATLGREWRIFGQTYKVVPTETITHGPVECALAILPRAAGRIVDRMTFRVNPLVQSIADERRARFGAPSSESEACFDLRHCVAAAWLRGHFTTAETAPACYTDPAVLALRDRIDLIADDSRKTFEGCSLEVTFTDGSYEAHNVDFFLGTPGARVPDQMLVDLLAQYGRGVIPDGRAEEIAAAIWTLDEAPSLAPLFALLRTT